MHFLRHSVKCEDNVRLELFGEYNRHVKDGTQCECDLVQLSNMEA